MRNDILFGLNPVNIDISRTKFDRTARNSTTFNVGDLCPFYCDEVMPGDTFDITTAAMIRFSSPLDVPLLDDLFIDFYYFFVPMRLCWEHSKEFFGENNQNAWIPQVEYTIPQLNGPVDLTTGKIVGYGVNSPAAYMGVNIGAGAGVSKDYADKFSINALPIRAYCLIWNEFFRDQNLQDPVFIPLDDTDRDVDVAHTDLTAYAYEGYYMLKANKTHDYFTSCLPGPQKGPSVELPFGSQIPVIAGAQSGDNILSFSKIKDDYGVNDIAYYRNNGTTLYTPSSEEVKNIVGKTFDTGKAFTLVGNSNATSTTTSPYLTPYNLVGDLASATAITINEFRQAFQVQKFYEKLARGGSRYIELVKAFFDVESADSRVQRPEYLGGRRQDLNIEQVVQTSSTDATSPQGNLTAISETSIVNNDFVKSFTEHGYIIGLAVVRYNHKYGQGLDPMWSRKSRFDFYFPVFANLGEQAVKVKEIYNMVDDPANYNPDTDIRDKVFGYQERYADSRYKRSYASGEFATNQKMWTLTDFYSSRPYLSKDWIKEDQSNVDRSLVVTSQNSHQVYLDVLVQNYCTRPMPLHSIPGLVDHH